MTSATNWRLDRLEQAVGPLVEPADDAKVATRWRAMGVIVAVLAVGLPAYLAVRSSPTAAAVTKGLAALVGALGTLGQAILAANGGATRRRSETQAEHRRRLAVRDAFEPWAWGALCYSVIALAVAEAFGQEAAPRS